MNLLLYVLSLIGTYFIVLLGYSKFSHQDLPTTNIMLKQQVFAFIKKVYWDCKEVDSWSAVNLGLCLSIPEAEEFVSNIKRYVESAVLIGLYNDNQYCYLTYDVTGIKQKFQENIVMTKRALAMDLKNHLKQSHMLNYTPVIICTSLIEGQLSFKIALTRESANTLLQTKQRNEVTSVKHPDSFPLCFDLSFYQKYKLYLSYYLNMKEPHLLLVGASGSGKTTALKVIIYQLLSVNIPVDLWVFDFKNSEDFHFLKQYPRYFAGNSCIHGLEDFYNLFQETRENNISNKTYHVIVFDEFPAYILYLSSQDKKKADKHKQYISEILMLGRGCRFGGILIMQRPDSTFLSNGARDNFQNIIALRHISSECKQMLFSGMELPDTNYQTGEGLLYQSGKPLEEIKFPKLTEQKIKEIDAKILDKLQVSCSWESNQSEL